MLITHKQKQRLMKYLLLIPFLAFALWSCSRQNPDHAKLEDVSANKDKPISSTNASSIPVNAEYPFGCAELTAFTYPRHWEGNLEEIGHLKQPDGQLFEHIGHCFNLIHSVKKIETPTILHVELIEIGTTFKLANNLNITKQSSFDHCLYRLPDIGIYEVYYAFNQYGNLILLNPATHDAKLLNIYADDLGGDSSTVLRYFYMEKNEIQIYEASYYDDGCTLNKHSTITIQADGQLNIHTL